MMSGVTSRSKSQSILEHWRDFIFEFDGKVLDWFNNQSFARIEEFAILRDDEIDIIEYVDANGTTTPAPAKHKIRIKAAIGYYHHVHHYYNDDVLDILGSTLHINSKSFDKFYVLEFNPRKEIIRYTWTDIQRLEAMKACIRRDREKIELIKLKISLLTYEKGKYGPCQAEIVLDTLHGTRKTSAPLFAMQHSQEPTAPRRHDDDDDEAADDDGDDEAADDDDDDEAVDDDDEEADDDDGDDDEAEDDDAHDGANAEDDEADGDDDDGDDEATDDDDDDDVADDDDDDDVDDGDDDDDDAADDDDDDAQNEDGEALLKRGAVAGLFEVYFQMVPSTGCWEHDPILPQIRKPPDPSSTSIMSTDFS
jgi:hypothetical protein